MSYVQGWAFKKPEVREAFITDFKDALTHLELPLPEEGADGTYRILPETRKGLYALVDGRRQGYNQFTVRLDPKCQGLTDRQKVLIADQGNACFGGHVSGLQVHVFTD